MLKLSRRADNDNMRGHKTPAVAFITRLIYTSSRDDFAAFLAHSPLTSHERELVLLYADGALYKELADRYHVTEAAIYAQKRKAYEKLARYYITKT